MNQSSTWTSLFGGGEFYPFKYKHHVHKNSNFCSRYIDKYIFQLLFIQSNIDKIYNFVIQDINDKKKVKQNERFFL